LASGAIGISATLISYQDNRIIVAPNGYDALAMDAGSLIDGNAPSNGQWTDLSAYFNGYYLDQTYGQFYNLNAFVGVEFEIEGETHYGWVQFDNPNPIYGGYVTGFAYETEPNTAIEAGAIPEPSTIGLFIMGLGVFVYRRSVRHETGNIE
jgi:hypothetical protein